MNAWEEHVLLVTSTLTVSRRENEELLLMSHMLSLYACTFHMKYDSLSKPMGVSLYENIFFRNKCETLMH